MFQHRHFKAIADLLAETREQELGIYGGGSIREELLDRLEERFIKTFKRDNPNFKPERFRSAARRSADMHGKDK